MSRLLSSRGQGETMIIWFATFNFACFDKHLNWDRENVQLVIATAWYCARARGVGGCRHLFSLEDRNIGTQMVYSHRPVILCACEAYTKRRHFVSRMSGKETGMSGKERAFCWHAGWRSTIPSTKRRSVYGMDIQVWIRHNFKISNPVTSPLCPPVLYLVDPLHWRQLSETSSGAGGLWTFALESTYIVSTGCANAKKKKKKKSGSIGLKTRAKGQHCNTVNTMQ